MAAVKPGRPAVSDALTVRGTAQEIIAKIDTPERAAEFYVGSRGDYEAVVEVMKHVRLMLMTFGKEKPFQVGNQLIAVEPLTYEYDLPAVRELAPECLKFVELPRSPAVESIHRIAGSILEEMVTGEVQFPRQMIEALSEIVELSQAQEVAQVDGRKLTGLLGRGDGRAKALLDRGVKTPSGWKLTVKEV